MTSRSATCADCGAIVGVASGAPVVRRGAVVLLCRGCRDPIAEAPRRAAPAPPAPDGDEDYEAIVMAPADDDSSSEYETMSISVADGPDPRTEPRSSSAGVVHSEDLPVVSGAIDTDRSETGKS